MKKIVFALLSLVLASSPAFAFAATAGLTGSASVGVNGSASSSAGTNVDVGLEAPDDYRPVSATGSASGGANLEVNAAGITVTMPSQVSTQADLDLYTRNSMRTDASLSAVQTSEGEVNVSYRHPGRFLGVIPVTVTSRTSVVAEDDGKARIKVRMPWWNFLVTGTHKVKADVESRLAADAAVSAGASANATASSRAAMVAKVIATLKAEADASASANANASN